MLRKIIPTRKLQADHSGRRTTLFYDRRLAWLSPGFWHAQFQLSFIAAMGLFRGQSDADSILP